MWEVVGMCVSVLVMVVFVLVLGMVMNVVAAVSARAFGYGDACWRGAGGFVFVLKMYWVRVDYVRGYCGWVSFFGFIDVLVEMVSVVEIVILVLMDSSSTALNLYGAGVVVGFMVVLFE